jgi:hypothetical protein
MDLGRAPRHLVTPGCGRIIQLDENGYKDRYWNELMTVAQHRHPLADLGQFGLE